MYTNLPQQVPAYYYVPQTYRAPMADIQQPQTATGASIYGMPPSAQQANYIKGRPVVSIDEARASQIDLDGSLHVFPDIGNKKIYTKQINLDGTATFNTFEMVSEISSNTSQNNNYVTRSELDEIIAELKISLQNKSKPASTQNFNL